MGQLCDKENPLWVQGTFPSLLSNPDICRSPATGACGHGKRSAVLFLQKTGRWLEVTLLGYEWRPHNLINHNTVLISAVICGGGRLGAQGGDRLSMNPSAAWLICSSLAILNALRQIPRNEAHEAAGFKNDGWIHIEKYLT